MFKKILLLSLMLVSLVLSACSITVNVPNAVRGSGNVTTEERSVSGFTGVALVGIGRMEVVVGDTESLVIEAEENLLPYLISEVKDGRLIVRIANGVNLRPTKPVRYTVTVKSLDNLEVGGSGDVICKSVTATAFDMAILGSGDIEIGSLQADSLDATIGGSGSINVEGAVQTQTVRILGSGSYKGKDLQSADAKVEVLGSGSVHLWVTDTLDVNIAASGSVNYYGNPTVHKTILGSGDVNQRGNK